MRYLALPGRLTRSARKLRLHLPRRWPWAERFGVALDRLRCIWNVQPAPRRPLVHPISPNHQPENGHGGSRVRIEEGRAGALHIHGCMPKTCFVLPSWRESPLRSATDGIGGQIALLAHRVSTRRSRCQRHVPRFRHSRRRPSGSRAGAGSGHATAAASTIGGVWDVANAPAPVHDRGQLSALPVRVGHYRRTRQPDASHPRGSRHSASQKVSSWRRLVRNARSQAARRAAGRPSAARSSRAAHQAARSAKPGSA
jgi:hypothetical protein